MPREVDGNLQECDNFEKTLRPQSLNEYIGQSELKENLNAYEDCFLVIYFLNVDLVILEMWIQYI